MHKKTLGCIMGPTASGKTALACALVSRLPVELISVDSAMIYRGMDIGTAKPDAATLAQAPHHLIDILNPTERYSAAAFCAAVEQISEDIVSRGKLPLLVGGTMMYFQALQQGLSALPMADETIRAEILQQAMTQGWEKLHADLSQIDPVAAQRIHPHDTQRIQRALEVYRLTGEPLSNLLQATQDKCKMHFVNVIVMPPSRDVLHQRIAERFQEMLALGLIDEVQGLVEKWSLTTEHPSMRSVGYRQVFDYLQQAYNYEILCEKGIAATRQLAKRQLTWLRHWSYGDTIVIDDPTDVNTIEQRLARKYDV